MKKEFIINSQHSLAETISEIVGIYENKKWVRVITNCGRRRTDRQNNAIHLYCRMVAGQLNEQGFPAFINSPLFKEPIEVEWSMETVKQLWHLVQANIYPDKKVSTGELERSEVSEIYDILNRALIEKTNGRVNVPFPSLETQNELTKCKKLSKV
jgi:hypothetical protein